jgi:hypothetical protein
MYAPLTVAAFDRGGCAALRAYLLDHGLSVLAMPSITDLEVKGQTT